MSTTILDPSDPAYAGQAQYTPFFLAHVYDPLVVRYANRFAWRCSSRKILRLYDRCAADVHLDVGPGTGWFLHRCRFPTATPDITLLDANADVLDVASARIARYEPQRLQANLLEPIDVGDRRFGSIGLAHVLHCLPGDMRAKARALDHLAPLLRPGGRLFGTTVLNGGVRHTRFSRSYLEYLNKIGVFNNHDDDLATLDRLLGERFARHELRTVGRVAEFVATV